jgi:hypothetical protein
MHAALLDASIAYEDKEMMVLARAETSPQRKTVNKQQPMIL